MVADKALLYNAMLVIIRPMPASFTIGSRQNFDLGAFDKVGHKVGLTIRSSLRSDGRRRRFTTFVAEKLIELLLVRTVGSFDFAVELRSASFDVGVSDPEIFDMPMEFGLELVTVVSSNFANAERKLLYDVVNEIDGVCLRMLLVDLEGPNAGRIVDRGVLETANLFALFSIKGQKLNVHLNVMPWHLLLIAFGVQFAHSCASGQPIKTIAFEDAADPSNRNFDAMVGCQRPNDPDRSQVIFAAQMQNFRDDLSWRLICGIFRSRFGILQPSFAMFLLCFAPSVETGPTNPKIPAGFAGVTDLLSVPEHSQFALNVAFFVRHEYFLDPKLGDLQEVSRKSVHIYMLQWTRI